MSELPPNLSGGAPWATPNDLNMVRQFALTNSAASGSPGMRRQSFGGGTILKRVEQIKRRGGGGAAAPFTLYLTDDGANLKGSFTPGTINGLLPSNFLSLTGIAKTGTVYIVLTVTLSNAQPQIATFSTETNAPDAIPVTISMPPTSLCILTHFVVDGAVYRVIGNGSIGLSALVAFETDKTPPIPAGARKTDLWYTYNVFST